MQYIELNESNNFELERIQNRQIRLELYLLKNKTYVDDMEQTYLFKNSTPPSSSDNFSEFDYLKDSSRDLESGYDYEPIPCPICFDTIWRDTTDITCFYCNKNFCFDCYLKLERKAYDNNEVLACPLCRGLFTTYENNDENNDINNEIERVRLNRREQRNAIIEQEELNNIERNDEFAKATKIIAAIIILIVFVILLYSGTI